MSDQPSSSAAVAAPATSQGLQAPPTPLPDASEQATTTGGRSLRKRAATGTSFAEPPSPTDEYLPDYLTPSSTGGNGGGEGAPGDRTTRSGTAFANRPKWMPKLKLKVSEGADGRRQSFLGPYDRDLDSEDEELVFEEQFILKMPPGKDCDRLREIASKRGTAPDIWFKFKGEMLVVDEATLPNEDALLAQKRAFNANEFVWPHGMTPPLRHVRKRRFRKRLNRQVLSPLFSVCSRLTIRAKAIETVENEVARLLAEEKNCSRVEERVIEDAAEDLSDSEYIAQVFPPATPDENASDAGDVKEENDDEIFAAAIADALREASEEEEEEEEEEEASEGGSDGEGSGSGSGSGSDSGEDEDDDDEEYSGAKKLVDDEIRQLETAIAKKNEDIAKVTNVALKTRFINAVAKMTADLEGKLALREQIMAEHRAQRERDAMEEGADSSDEGEEGEEFYGEPMDMA
ncbi:related to TAF7-TFIID subunit (TBP-associated factor), 67 kD [Serendipita indica DSM 11827]|uniref:Related to TAF7-TFIID subunit (TBP-associated factor), 67 kD n=1 Tax=Serendipita indica (strain DSM 11827) TaxID=1109443 RepID=G4TEN4_SERID|nr:related to TAF7-TFIID subunit (TBP-associated factor), 67 kD [Serendipita indica DSM 11827]